MRYFRKKKPPPTHNSPLIFLPACREHPLLASYSPSALLGRCSERHSAREFQLFNREASGLTQLSVSNCLEDLQSHTAARGLAKRTWPALVNRVRKSASLLPYPCKERGIEDLPCTRTKYERQGTFGGFAIGSSVLRTEGLCAETGYGRPQHDICQSISSFGQRIWCIPIQGGIDRSIFCTRAQASRRAGLDPRTCFPVKWL